MLEIEWNTVLSAVSIAVSGVVGFYLHVLKMNKDSLEEIDALSKEINQQIKDHERRLIGIENKVEHLPTDQDIRAVTEEINYLKINMERVATASEMMSQTLRLIQVKIMGGEDKK